MKCNNQNSTERRKRKKKGETQRKRKGEAKKTRGRGKVRKTYSDPTIESERTATSLRIPFCASDPCVGASQSRCPRRKPGILPRRVDSASHATVLQGHTGGTTIRLEDPTPLMFAVRMRVVVSGVDPNQLRGPSDTRHREALLHATTPRGGRGFAGADAPARVRVSRGSCRGRDRTLITDYVEGQNVISGVSQGKMSPDAGALYAATPRSHAAQDVQENNGPRVRRM